MPVKTAAVARRRRLATTAPHRLLRRAAPTAPTASRRSSSATSPRPSTPSPPARCCASRATSRSSSRSSARRPARPTRWSGRTTTPAPRSPRRCSPARSTSARWATTRCSSTAPRAGKPASTATEMVSVTGYNPKGALNGVVVGADSDVTSLERPRGQEASRASVGSAGHGTLVQALDEGRHRPRSRTSRSRTSTRRSAPPRCRPARSTPSAQFVAWPGLLVFRDDDRLVYDGGRLDVPTLHGVVVRKEFAAEDRGRRRRLPAGPASRPPTTCTSTRSRPPRSSPRPTGLPAGGRLPLQRPQRRLDLRPDAQAGAGRRARARRAVPRSRSASSTDPLDVDSFVDDSLVRQGRRGRGYDRTPASTAEPGRDHRPRRGLRAAGHGRRRPPARSGSRARTSTRPVADPTCLLRTVAAGRGRRRHACARSYVPDAADRHPLVRRPDGLAAVDGAATSAVRHRRTTPTSTSTDHPGAEPRDLRARRWRRSRDDRAARRRPHAPARPVAAADAPRPARRGRGGRVAAGALGGPARLAGRRRCCCGTC